jgi:hypothetical protein
MLILGRELDSGEPIILSTEDRRQGTYIVGTGKGANLVHLKGVNLP